MASDPFTLALRSEGQLREIYGAADPTAWRKDVGRLDHMCARLIAASRMVFIASFSAEGRCDVTPRGGAAGFVTVLDEKRLAIPDATGNRRIDTLRNVVATGQAGLVFLVAGRSWTLRINGRACVVAEPAFLESLVAVGKPPRTAVVVEAEEVYAHCPKAFVRSELWEPETWLAPDDLPSPAEVARAHLGGSLKVEDIERRQQESLRHRLE